MSNNIPLEECEDGYLYWINARNGSLGVFQAELKGFTFIRTKWDDRFLFTEYHWDTGPPLGTARARLKLEKAPIFGSAEDLFNYLEEVSKIYFRTRLDVTPEKKIQAVICTSNKSVIVGEFDNFDEASDEAEKAATMENKHLANTRNM